MPEDWFKIKLKYDTFVEWTINYSTKRLQFNALDALMGDIWINSIITRNEKFTRNQFFGLYQIDKVVFDRLPFSLEILDWISLLSVSVPALVKVDFLRLERLNE